MKESVKPWERRHQDRAKKQKEWADRKLEWDNRDPHIGPKNERKHDNGQMGNFFKRFDASNENSRGKLVRLRDELTRAGIRISGKAEKASSTLVTREQLVEPTHKRVLLDEESNKNREQVDPEAIPPLVEDVEQVEVNQQIYQNLLAAESDEVIPAISDDVGRLPADRPINPYLLDAHSQENDREQNPSLDERRSPNPRTFLFPDNSGSSQEVRDKGKAKESDEDREKREQDEKEILAIVQEFEEEDRAETDQPIYQNLKAPTAEKRSWRNGGVAEQLDPNHQLDQTFFFPGNSGSSQEVRDKGKEKESDADRERQEQRERGEAADVALARELIKQEQAEIKLKNQELEEQTRRSHELALQLAAEEKRLKEAQDLASSSSVTPVTQVLPTSSSVIAQPSVTDQSNKPEQPRKPKRKNMIVDAGVEDERPLLADDEGSSSTPSEEAELARLLGQGQLGQFGVPRQIIEQNKDELPPSDDSEGESDDQVISADSSKMPLFLAGTAGVLLGGYLLRHYEAIHDKVRSALGTVKTRTYLAGNATREKIIVPCLEVVKRMKNNQLTRGDMARCGAVLGSCYALHKVAKGTGIYSTFESCGSVIKRGLSSLLKNDRNKILLAGFAGAISLGAVWKLYKHASNKNLLWHKAYQEFMDSLTIEDLLLLEVEIEDATVLLESAKNDPSIIANNNKLINLLTGEQKEKFEAVVMLYEQTCGKQSEIAAA